jgi:hypothetical protein
MSDNPNGPNVPELQLTSFEWDRGTDVVKIVFQSGFNLLQHGDQNERTIILRLIRYGMGGSESRIDNNIARLTKEVRLEFLANGLKVRTTRGFEHPGGQFAVLVEGRPPLMLSPNDMGGFLLDILEIPIVRYQRGDNRIVLSFNDLARGLVVDRDFSYTEIMAKMYPEPRREAVKLLLGLTTQEIADAEEEIRKAESDVLHLTEEIRGIERLLKDFNVDSLLEIEQRRSNLLTVLHQVDQEENDLRRAVAEAASASTVQSSDAYGQLRDEFVGRRTRLGEIDNELAALAKQTLDKADLREQLSAEVDKLERHTSSQFVLSTFSFSKCPRCLRPIDAAMRAREDEGECQLCGRPLDPTHSFDADAWHKAVADARRMVQECEFLLNFYRDRQGALGIERAEINVRLAWLETELARQTQQYVAPLIEQLSLLNARRMQVQQSLNELDLEERQRRYALRVHDEQLPELKAKLDQRKGHLEELRLRHGRSTARIEALLTHYRSFIRESASSHYESASWDETELLPMVNDQPYTKAMTGYDLAIAVLAFHYALLALKVSPPRFRTSHPGLLIVDEPHQQNMESHQYLRIMQQLLGLANRYSESVQVIVAATDVTGIDVAPLPVSTASVTSDLTGDRHVD